MGTKKQTKYFRLQFSPTKHQEFKMWSVANQTSMAGTIQILIDELLKADKGEYSSVDIDSVKELLEQRGNSNSESEAKKETSSHAQKKSQET